MNYLLGIDIGSTTVKLVLTKDGHTVYEKYERHFSRVREKTAELLSAIRPLTQNEQIAVAVSGSAGLGLSEEAGLPFIQEVFATGEVVKNREPDTSVVIELGGEDAKIIFFRGGIDERMNGSCAGGTGAFIDQMATLLDVTVDELDRLSLQYERIYPIASRCGVFAKTDIQPLMNQGARKEDIAMSIYQAVVNQTIAGLAQGRKIEGKVLFLGGPLYYCKGLRLAFKQTLMLSDENAVFPDYALYAVALGASYYAEKENALFTIDALLDKIKNAKRKLTAERLPPLFATEEDYKAFVERHAKASVKTADIATYRGKAYLGIDCGSTTTKLVLISADKEILYTYYASNLGNPIEVIKTRLAEIYDLCKDRITIAGSAVTGYGEELMRNAFSVDCGIVETIAHYTAAKFFRPDVDFIIDIGGQDIKCFKIRNGAIDSIMLNEACSSGCGSFLETFAKSMGYNIADFAKQGLQCKAPVNLGSRCTVFMNSSVKQSQKEGATVADISGGLAVSVIKNAVYKVIRASSAAELGENIVVQGGTFYNDAVLRAFENELHHTVIRPNIAGLMGAFGAALYAMKCTHSDLISPEALAAFTHSAVAATCHKCMNRCRLTVNTFSDGRRYISGNRCEKGLGIKSETSDTPNLYAYKRDYLLTLAKDEGEAVRGTVGMPLALGMYELFPLWHAIFRSLGFRVITSGMSTRATYEKGQFSIPSDTACYPAKLMHGHIENLLAEKPDAVFYPCLSYNVDEHASDNHYNCPVVAYYSELLAGNVEDLKKTKFFYPYLSVNDEKELTRELTLYLNETFGNIGKSEIAKAVHSGFVAYQTYIRAVHEEGERAIAYAREKHMPIMVLAGRPYHIDEEISHGIDKLAVSLGFTVVSEDSVAHLTTPPDKIRVLNQWTYHARLYRAAKFVTENPDMQLVQMVSFGCGVDAITSDEVRSILERKGKFYTQLKIDEITNLGAVKIRLRSLIGAMEGGNV